MSLTVRVLSGLTGRAEVIDALTRLAERGGQSPSVAFDVEAALALGKLGHAEVAREIVRGKRGLEWWEWMEFSEALLQHDSVDEAVDRLLELARNPDSARSARLS